MFDHYIRNHKDSDLFKIKMAALAMSTASAIGYYIFKIGAVVQ